MPRCSSADTTSDGVVPTAAGIECRPRPRSNSMSWSAYSTSKPATQSNTAPARARGVAWTSPRIAIQAPRGAPESASPSTRWDRAVNRFVYE